jgi:DNA replication protein DnaC
LSASVERLPASCPFGVCDGSGWIVDDDDTARPCECRDRRIAQARTRGVRSVLPAKFQGVSFDRPPISDMARDPQAGSVVDAVREYIAGLEGRITNGRGLWIEGSVGTGKTTLAMLVSRKAIEAGFTAAIYSLPSLNDAPRVARPGVRRAGHRLLQPILITQTNTRESDRRPRQGGR